MKKLILLFLLSFSLQSFCQHSSYFWDNVKFGGGFTASFGNQTTIGISPSAIYKFDNGFAVGTGLGYLYSEINDFTTNVYSTSLIGIYQTNIGIQLSTDFDYYFANQYCYSRYGFLGLAQKSCGCQTQP